LSDSSSPANRMSAALLKHRDFSGSSSGNRQRGQRVSRRLRFGRLIAEEVAVRL
jgi:hypothetical protein